MIGPRAEVFTTPLAWQVYELQDQTAGYTDNSCCTVPYKYNLLTVQLDFTHVTSSNILTKRVRCVYRHDCNVPLSRFLRHLHHIHYKKLSYRKETVRLLRNI